MRVTLQILLAGLPSLSPLSFLPFPFSLGGYGDGDTENSPLKLGHHFSSMADAGKTPKCPFVSSYLLILATEQQNRGRYYQRHFCSKENLDDPYFCWKFFLLLEQWNHFSLLISA